MIVGRASRDKQANYLIIITTGIQMRYAALTGKTDTRSSIRLGILVGLPLGRSSRQNLHIAMLVKSEPRFSTLSGR